MSLFSFFELFCSVLFSTSSENKSHLIGFNSNVVPKRLVQPQLIKKNAKASLSQFVLNLEENFSEFKFECKLQLSQYKSQGSFYKNLTSTNAGPTETLQIKKM